jgi:hypothetical protein
MSENTIPVNVTFTAQLSRKVLGDILSTAIEGGCNYWADMTTVRAPKDDPDDVFYLSSGFRDREDVSVSPVGGNVGLAEVAKGIERILTPEFQASPGLKKLCLMLCVDPDNADYDASDADNIIQAALFNEIIYA